MSVDIRTSDRRKYVNDLQGSEKEVSSGLIKVSQSASSKALQETEKRIRREIANSNERRRMQCINAGFSNLRALIPQSEGEKLSKAAILQHATEYITSMEKDKTRLQVQLDHTKRMLLELGHDRVVPETYVSCLPPPSKRKKRDTESSDEGVGSLSDASDDGGSELQHENVTLRHQLEVERQRCATLEERNSFLETQLLTVLQVQAPHSSSLSELCVVGLERRKQVPHYSREVVEVAASPHQTCSPSPIGDSFQHPKTVPSAVERGVVVESSARLDAATNKSHLDSSRYCSGDVHVSPTLKVEIIPTEQTSAASVVLHVPSVELTTVSSTTATPTTISASANQHNYPHHHSFSHRDHPRRRHRQQAQLEQQRAEEEELRSQQEEQRDVTVVTPSLCRPKHNTQNLHNLVEAIRQIEGDRVLGGERKFSEDELYDQHPSILRTEECERKTDRANDQDELPSQGSGRDSPLHHHHHDQQQHHQNIITSPHMTTSTITASPKSSINISSSFSEKYPTAAHLLHRPVHPSYYRPGVIVHKP